MRGYWWVAQGTTAGAFDTLQQAVVFADNGVFTSQVNASGRSIPSAAVSSLAGRTVTVKVTASGGAQMKIDLVGSGVTALSTGYLGDAGTVTFVWPANGTGPVRVGAERSSGRRNGLGHADRGALTR